MRSRGGRSTRPRRHRAVWALQAGGPAVGLSARPGAREPGNARTAARRSVDAAACRYAGAGPPRSSEESTAVDEVWPRNRVTFRADLRVYHLGVSVLEGAAERIAERITERIAGRHRLHPRRTARRTTRRQAVRGRPRAGSSAASGVPGQGAEAIPVAMSCDAPRPTRTGLTRRLQPVYPCSPACSRDGGRGPKPIRRRFIFAENCPLLQAFPSSIAHRFTQSVLRRPRAREAVSRPLLGTAISTE